MKNILTSMAVLLVVVCCGISEAEVKPSFVGKWANVKDFREKLEIEKNGSSYLVTVTTPDRLLGGPPNSTKIPATSDKDNLRIEGIIRLTLAIDNKTGLLVTSDGQFRRLTGVAEDRELRGCWKPQSMTKYYADRVDKEDVIQGSILFYDGIYATSFSNHKNASPTVVSSYQFLRPGVLEIAIEKNDRNPSSLGSISEIEYAIRNGQLFITTFPKDSTTNNPKKLVKFESTSKFLPGLSKQECMKEL